MEKGEKFWIKKHCTTLKEFIFINFNHMKALNELYARKGTGSKVLNHTWVCNLTLCYARDLKLNIYHLHYYCIQENWIELKILQQSNYPKIAAYVSYMIYGHLKSRASSL